MIGNKFTRQPNGTYLREDGDWPGNLRAQLQAEDQKPFGNYSREEAIAFLEGAIAKNQVRKAWYAVVPNGELKQTRVQAEESTVVAAKEKKAKKRQDKKVVAQEKAAVEIATRKPRTLKTAVPNALAAHMAAEDPDAAKEFAKQQAARPGTLDSDKVVQMYRNSVKIVDIAVAFGYARGQGQNKIRAILREAKVYNTPTGGAQATSVTN